MNATKWLTLTEFVKHLGKEGKCRVDETPKGWFISLIQADPMAELSAERRVKRDRCSAVHLLHTCALIWPERFADMWLPGQLVFRTGSSHMVRSRGPAGGSRLTVLTHSCFDGMETDHQRERS
jgi:Domain of Kin17 curved DNA-binding protein